MQNETCIGYLRYSGKLVDEGFLDARKSAQALIGFDEALRFFISYQVPQLADVDYEIPVRVQKGSWEALIPDSVGKWVLMALGAGATVYVTTAAKKMAESDFKEAGIKTLFARSLESILWIARIGAHVGDMTQKTFQGVKWRNNNQEVGLPNAQGEHLFVPKEQLEAWRACDPSLLSKMSEIVEADREMTLGLFKDDSEQRVNISITQKSIFIPNHDDTQEVLFPEFLHGQYVELEGSTTRGNKNTNTIGFKYRDHILTCYPQAGRTVVEYKRALFLRCRIYGVISRADEFGRITEKRPKIHFSNLVPIEEDLSPLPLFKT